MAPRELIGKGLSYRRAERYIPASLELLPELQRTGNIFFPKSWLDATLGGHRNPSAAARVREFLAENPALEPRLRGKLLQSADPLFRIRARVICPICPSPGHGVPGFRTEATVGGSPM